MSRSRGAAVRLSEAAPLFAALGDETRLRLVTRLCAEGPLSIARLSEGSPITRQAITRHLESLASACGSFYRSASRKRAAASIRSPSNGTWPSFA
jgi:hypothetical protein